MVDGGGYTGQMAEAGVGRTGRVGECMLGNCMEHRSGRGLR